MPVIRLDKEYLGSVPKNDQGKPVNHWAVMIEGPEQTAIAIPETALLYWICPDIDGGTPMPFMIRELHIKRGIRLRCTCNQKTCTLEWKNGKFTGRHPKIARDA